jgi:pimeloyl-ACP methyl ester carboxylesterase
MKKSLFFITILLCSVCCAQTQRRVFLFVHGAWGGGWEYANVDSILTAKGDVVFRPTLTGLGERIHLADSQINLTTHINDIVNVIKFENLHDIILVGHSYGGMVISGVAEQVPERIKQLIYLDAHVPKNGESIKTIFDSVDSAFWEEAFAPRIKHGYIYYPGDTPSPNPPSDVPQPLKTFTEAIKISNPLVVKIPTAYILMMKDGKAPFDEYGASVARKRGWKIFTLVGDHYPMRNQPIELANKLEEVLK